MAQRPTCVSQEMCSATLIKSGQADTSSFPLTQSSCTCHLPHQTLGPARQIEPSEPPTTPTDLRGQRARASRSITPGSDLAITEQTELPVLCQKEMLLQGIIVLILFEERENDCKLLTCLLLVPHHPLKPPSHLRTQMARTEREEDLLGPAADKSLNPSGIYSGT